MALIWRTLESAGRTGARFEALTAADGEPRAVGVHVAHGPAGHALSAAEQPDGPTAVARARRLEALAGLWPAGVDVTRGYAHGAHAVVALPGTAMLRRPVGTGLPTSGGPAR
ncbi:hypothetical protein [Streptomyces sp. NPDC048612]|uniref:hypothetical protein n=1 Tax=Streptomyces sp. NPDC048612 TaxID=3365579 RepID=UPI003723466F